MICKMRVSQKAPLLQLPLVSCFFEAGYLCSEFHSNKGASRVHAQWDGMCTNLHVSGDTCTAANELAHVPDITMRMCVQALAAHDDFLRRVMKGTLLSRKVKVLRSLLDLKNVVHRWSSLPSFTFFALRMISDA